MAAVEYIAGAALLAAGYGLGQWRPGHRLSGWAHRTLNARGTGRRGARWWAAWLVVSAEELALLAAHPRQTAYAWRHRNDPPELEPAPVPIPDWAAKRKEAR